MIRDLKEEDIREIARLEQESYPEFLCLGYEDFLYDFKKFKSCSMVASIKNQIKGYIYAYQVKDRIYISDFCCKHSTLLLPLWNSFCLKNAGNICEAELREVSYQLIKRMDEWIEKIDFDFNKNYYQLEDAYSVVFKIKQDFDWKKKTLHSVYYENNLEFINEEGSDISFHKRLLLKREKLK